MEEPNPILSEGRNSRKWTAFKIWATGILVIVGSFIAYKNVVHLIEEGLDVKAKVVIEQIFTIIIILHLATMYILPQKFNQWAISFTITIFISLIYFGK